MKTIVKPSTEKNTYKLIRGGKIVGRIRYWGASREDHPEWDFKDPGDEGIRKPPRYYSQEYMEIIDRFYEKKEAHVGFLPVRDENEFMEVLKQHSIRDYWNEGLIFFFNTEEDLFAARMLV